MNFSKEFKKQFQEKKGISVLNDQIETHRGIKS